MAKHPVTRNGGYSEIDRTTPTHPPSLATLSCHTSPGKQEARAWVGLGWGDHSGNRPPDATGPKPNPPSTTQGRPRIWIQVLCLFREAHPDYLISAHPSQAPCLLVLDTLVSEAP